MKDDLLNKKSEYVNYLQKRQQMLSRLIYSIAIIIPLIIVIWLVAETYSIKMLDNDSRKARLRDAALLGSFLILVNVFAAKIIVNLFNKMYDGFKPIILSLSENDWNVFLTLQKQLIKFRNYLPYYIVSKDTISVFYDWEVKSFNYLHIQSFCNYGLVPQGLTGLWYVTEVKFDKNHKMKFSIKEERIHQFLLDILSAAYRDKRSEQPRLYEVTEKPLFNRR